MYFIIKTGKKQGDDLLEVLQSELVPNIAIEKSKVLMTKLYFVNIILLMISQNPSAQLCEGSLGDPIVNITFGVGTNPGLSLKTTANLNFFQADCPNDGQYTIRNNTTQCFGNTWHTLSQDHTGDANGYFMLINASLQQSEFYIDTVKGLCPNTTYEFAAWIMNVILPSACSGTTIPPNLTFNIETPDRTILQTYSTGNLSAVSVAQWKQYGFFFKTPGNVSNVVLRILNNSQGGCGNDLAIDDITFRSCGPKLAVAFGDGVQSTLKELCEDDNADIVFVGVGSPGYTNPSYKWQISVGTDDTWTDIPGANSTTLIQNYSPATPAADYKYRLITAEAANINLPTCRIASNALTVRKYGKPESTIINNSPVCVGNSITLSADNAMQYNWFGPNGFNSTGSTVTISNAQLNNEGKYFLQVITSAGCKGTDSTTVLVTTTPVAVAGSNSADICKGQSVSLSSSGGSLFTWSPSEGLSATNVSDPIAKPSDTTTYRVIVSNSSACSDTAFVKINVVEVPRADAGPDHEILEGQSVQLPGIIYGNSTNFSWSPNLFISNVQELQPLVSPIENTRYILMGISGNGCGNFSDTTNITVFKKVIIPNAFSPNGDGVNDNWKITALTTYKNYELSVYNRFGNLVYTTKNYLLPWDGSYLGKPLPVGTYYYLINLDNKAVGSLKGYVVILR